MRTMVVQATGSSIQTYMMRISACVRPMRRIDDRFEANSLLQQVMRALLRRDCGYVLHGDADFHADAGETIERFQDVVIQVGG